MSDVAIRVEGLSKRYRIGGPKVHHHLRDQLADLAGAPLRWAKRLRSGAPADDARTFWALRDVNFEVKTGEVVGVIGRNGAGKSTLLKILSRITGPTEGQVDIFGRVGSLLEVGTGFHPELTGRENVYLNGAILGMTRQEVTRKFDEIVAFAEVEKFIDTPVKHYSSGMYMRLAFAVAAHLEPEILIVDEVLAVGDQQFQKKCLGKMSEVASHGRTVLFVSHNMGAIQALCESAMMLAGGALIQFGPTSEVLNKYLLEASSRIGEVAADIEICKKLTLKDLRFQPSCFSSGESVRVSVDLAAASRVIIHSVCVLIYSNQDIRVAIVDLRSPDGAYKLNSGEKLRLERELVRFLIVEGEYKVGLYIRTDDYARDLLDIVKVEVNQAELKSSLIPYPPGYRGFIEVGYEPVKHYIVRLPESEACSAG